MKRLLAVVLIFCMSSLALARWRQQYINFSEWFGVDDNTGNPFVCQGIADPAYTIQAYHLTAEQEAMFDPALNIPSYFWEAWNQQTLSTLELNADDISYGPEPESDADGTLIAKMAWGENGCYMLWSATDNDWAPFTGERYYDNDCVDFNLEQNSAQELYNNPDRHFVNSHNQFTNAFCQIQMMFGGNEPVSTFCFNWYDIMTSEMVMNPDVPLDAAIDRWGIQLKVFPFNPDDPNTRMQEWLIPWAIWGNTPGVPEPSEGERLALSGGYNDKDETATSYSALRWRNNADCWASELVDKSIDPTNYPDITDEVLCPVDAWGDIEFTGGFPNELSIKDYRPLQSSMSIARRAATVEYYTVSGKKLPVRNNLPVAPAQTIIFKRVRDAKGALISSSRMVVR